MISAPERALYYWVRLQGIRSRYADLPRGRAHYLDCIGRGSGPPVILVHGLAANAAAYRGFIYAARRRFRRVIVPDLPGHGLSAAPPGGLRADGLALALSDFLDFLVDRLKGELPLLVGNSLGAVGALRFALRRPEGLRALVLVSPGGAPPDRGRGLMSLVEQFAVSEPRAALHFIDKIYARPPMAPLRQLLALGVARRFGTQQVRGLLDSLREDHLLSAEELQALQLPVSLIWATNERIFGPQQLAFFRKFLPKNHHFEQIAALGHIGFLERPGSLAERVAEFASHLRTRPRPAEYRPRE